MKGRHVLYYLSLFAIMTMGVILVAFFKGQKQLQIAITILLAFFYALWGIIHHIAEHSFSLKIVLEYIAIGVLGISLILFVLNIAL